MWVLLAFVIGIVIIVLAFALGWIATPLDTMSAENTRRLSRQANDAWQALEAQRENILSVETQASDMILTYGEDQSTWPQGKREEYQQLRTQRQNRIAAYNTSCGQYNAMWQDEWRAIPAPDDLPTACDLYSG